MTQEELKQSNLKNSQRR